MRSQIATLEARTGPPRPSEPLSRKREPGLRCRRTVRTRVRPQRGAGSTRNWRMAGGGMGGGGGRSAGPGGAWARDPLFRSRVRRGSGMTTTTRKCRRSRPFAGPGRFAGGACRCGPRPRQGLGGRHRGDGGDRCRRRRRSRWQCQEPPIEWPEEPLRLCAANLHFLRHSSAPHVGVFLIA